MDALQDWEVGKDNRNDNKYNKGLNESDRKIRT
jgi:hypothetical protein